MADGAGGAADLRVPLKGGAYTTAKHYPAAPAGRSDAVLVLAHGAGAGQQHPFMVAFARGLAARGLDVVTLMRRTLVFCTRGALVSPM